MFEINETYYTIGKINLENIRDVNNFVNFVSEYSTNFYLISGRYIVDAKSIMGIFSLDLSKPVLFVSEEKINDDFLQNFKAQNFKKGEEI